MLPMPPMTIFNYHDHPDQEIVGHIPIKVDARIDKYRGLFAFGITMDRRRKTLYVACWDSSAMAVNRYSFPNYQRTYS